MFFWWINILNLNILNLNSLLFLWLVFYLFNLLWYFFWLLYFFYLFNRLFKLFNRLLFFLYTLFCFMNKIVMFMMMFMSMHIFRWILPNILLTFMCLPICINSLISDNFTCFWLRTQRLFLKLNNLFNYNYTNKLPSLGLVSGLLITFSISSTSKGIGFLP